MLPTPASALLLLLALAPPAARGTDSDGRGADARQILWQRDLDDAVALAQAEGRPLLLAVNMDGESASDRIVHEEYRDPDFVAATRACVSVVASVFRHSPRDYDDEGRRIPCPRLGEVTCGEHMLLEPVMFERFLSDGERVAPRHAVILPDGTKDFDLSLAFDLMDVDRALFASVAPFVSVASATSADAQHEGPRTAPATASSWSALAARRDHRGRARLEDALASAPDEATLDEALDAVAAHGDSGSIDALRVVGGRLPDLSPRMRARVVDVARTLDLARPLALALRALLVAPGPVPGQANGAVRAVLLPVLAELDGDAPDTRSFLLACRAVAEYGDDATRAVRRAFGADETAAIEASVSARGGALALGDVLRSADAVTRAAEESTLPLVGTVTDAVPAANELAAALDELDRELATNGDGPELRARFAKAMLDLARRRIDAGRSGVAVLLEDAERNFALALDADPSRAAWWVERARVAYFEQRFEDQVEYGRRAAALVGEAPGEPLAIEALRWVGDGQARLLGARSGGDPAVEVAGIVEGLRALSSVAASPYGDGTDWSSLASFLGAVGLLREEIAVASRGLERLPAVPELRQALHGALWSVGRIDLAPVVAEDIASRNPPSTATSWYTGYGWILAAEDHRRREACERALVDYERARAHYEAAGAPDFVALTWLGSGLARVRLGQRARAADCLVAAAATGVDVSGARDGLGYDVLDLVDKVLEWRASGPSDVDPLALLDELEAVAPGTPFWATAVSDSELREALRADGRNPERAERDSVDASGNPMRQVMGLPWEEGDAYLEPSIVAARRALRFATTDEDRRPLAQSCTIRAERQLELGRLEGVQAALAEAAPLLGFEAPAPDATEDQLRALARELRAALGEARPRWRQGR